MMQVRDLTELRLKDLWAEVKDEERWWGDLKQETIRSVKAVLEMTMEQEITEQLQAWKYGRTGSRRGYRNGFRERSLLTELGLIEYLRIPRDRDGMYQPSMLVAYQRRQREVNELVKEAFLAGISTRRVAEVLEPVLGEKLSPQTVSRILQSLDNQVRRYHHQMLKDEYRYLFLDGITLKVKSLGHRKKRCLVLCAYGITTSGKRELISFRQCDSEAENEWEAFLQDMYRRGLLGNCLELVVVDGCPGLREALDMIYPYAKIQRCWAHKLRNVANKLPRKVQEACLTGAKRIYQAKTMMDAKDRFLEWVQQWRSVAPEAVHCLEKDISEMLNFLNCPSECWRMVRTTNAIERSFREVRRRTRPMTSFNNPASVDRIIFGVINHLNKTWKEKPLSQFTH